ncbi:hypothetical protein [Nocardia salmonicida]|uniref:hypothetical protein n=1 Tax=Nocardia salmonicida TaxID=53431 RepID=UPI00364159DC
MTPETVLAINHALAWLYNGSSEPRPTYQTVPGSTGNSTGNSAENVPDTAQATDSDDDNSTVLLGTGIAVVAFALVVGGIITFTLFAYASPPIATHFDATGIGGCHCGISPLNVLTARLRRPPMRRT